MRKVTVVVSKVTDDSFAAYLSDVPHRTAIRNSREKVVGMIVKMYPGRFGLDPKTYNTERPSEEVGRLVLANPDAFDAVIEDRTPAPK